MSGPTGAGARGTVRSTDCLCGDRGGMRASRGQRGLSWLNFFVAAMGTGFGAFVPGYLAAQAWTQMEIGAVLSMDTLASMVGQVPAGALVDAIRRRRALLGVAISLIAVAALTLAVIPIRLPVVLALVLHSVASAVIGPAIAAISLALSGQCGLGERMGRNAQFAAIGGVVGAALMGAVGTLLPERAVFLLTAGLALPALYALYRSRWEGEQIHPDAEGCLPEQQSRPTPPLVLLRDRRLMVFASCVFLFFLSNAAIVLTAVGGATGSAVPFSAWVIAAFIIVPQLVVAAVSLRVGRAAERFGRRPLLLLGFASLPLRAALFAVIPNPWVLVLVQPLEGVGAAVFGVMLPLVAADLTRGTGRYNLCLGLLGFAGALGAAASTTFAGAVADTWGRSAAFAALSAAGLIAVVLLAAAMPETYRVTPEAPSESGSAPSEPRRLVAADQAHDAAG